MVVGDVLLCVVCECLRVTLMWKWDGGTRQQLPCSEAAMQQRQAKPSLLVRTTDIYLAIANTLPLTIWHVKNFTDMSFNQSRPSSRRISMRHVLRPVDIVPHKDYKKSMEVTWNDVPKTSGLFRNHKRFVLFHIELSVYFNHISRDICSLDYSLPDTEIFALPRVLFVGATSVIDSK